MTQLLHQHGVTYSTSLCSGAGCFCAGLVTQSGNGLTGSQDGLAIGADQRVLVTGLGAGCFLAGQSRIAVGTALTDNGGVVGNGFFRTGHGVSNCKTLHANLGGQLAHKEAVLRFCKGNSDLRTADGNGAGRADGVLQCRCIFAFITSKLDLGHTAERDLQAGTCIEAGGIDVISHGIRGSRLQVGDGDAVLLPNLLIGIKLGALCLIGKADVSGTGGAFSNGGLLVGVQSVQAYILLCHVLFTGGQELHLLGGIVHSGGDPTQEGVAFHSAGGGQGDAGGIANHRRDLAYAARNQEMYIIFRSVGIQLATALAEMLLIDVTGSGNHIALINDLTAIGAGHLAGETGLGAGCALGALHLGVLVAGSRDLFTGSDKLAAVGAHGVAGVTGHGAGCVLSASNSGVSVLASRCCLSSNGDAVDANLLSHFGNQEAILRRIEGNGNDLAADRNSSGRTDGVLQFSCIAGAIAGELDLGHAGECDLQAGALVETSGGSVIRNSIGRAGLQVGDGDTVLLPNLLVGVKLGTLCLIGKADGCRGDGGSIGSIAGIFLAALGAGAVHEVMSGSSDNRACVDGGTAIGTHGLAGVTVYGTSGFHSTLNLGVSVLASGLIGRLHSSGNGDALCAGLSGQLSDHQAIYRLSEDDGNDLVVDRYGNVGIGNRCGIGIHILSFQTRAIDHDLGHAGIFDLQVGALIEASGVIVVTHVAGGAALLVGNGDAVLCPNLLRGAIFGTLCSTCKADGRGGFRRFLRAAGGTGAADILVTGSSDDGASIDRCAAIGAYGLAGVTGLGAGRVLSTLNGGIGVLAGRNIGIIRLGSTAHCVQAGDIVGILQLRAPQDTHGHILAIGTDVANFIAYGGVQSGLLCIPGIDGACAGSEGKVSVGVLGHQIDVLLCAVGVHKVQVVAAGGLLNEEIDTIFISGIGGAVVAAHRTGEVVGSVLLGRNQAQLISSAGNQLLCHVAGGIATNGAGAVYVVVSSGDLIALVALGAQSAGIDGVAVGGAGGSNGLACHIVMGAVDGAGCLTGGSCHRIGDALTEQQECKFGIVHEYITGTGDGLNRVVTAQLPGIDGIFGHPLDQNIQALDNAGGTPHRAGVAPADIHIQHNAGNVAAQIQLAAGFAVGVIVAAALAVGLVATGAVFALSGGAQHHNIVLAIAGSVTLAVGPGVLTVPGSTRIPIGADGLTGIERGNGAGVTVFAVGVLEQISGCIIAGLIGLCASHQILQSLVQAAVGCIAGTGATGQRRQRVIGVTAGIECLRIIGQRGCDGAAGTPVSNVAGSIYGNQTCRQQAQAQNQCQNQCHAAFHEILHNITPYLYFVQCVDVLIQHIV